MNKEQRKHQQETIARLLEIEDLRDEERVFLESLEDFSSLSEEQSNWIFELKQREKWRME